MTDTPNLISADEAREYIDKKDSPTILIKYADDTREVETSREIIVTSEEQARRNSNNFDYRLAHTVIAQAEQIKKLHDAVDGLKYMAESSMHIADTTATAAGLSHLIDADGDGDWQTIWERVWGKLEEHKAQAEQIKRLQSAIGEIQRWEGANYLPPLIQMDVLKDTDMGDTDD